MIVQLGQPSPWQEGHNSRGLYSPRSVGTGIRPSRWAIISSKRGLTLSYSFPSSARIGPRWNSTSSIAIFGTSERRTRRRAFAKAGAVSSRRNRMDSSFASRTLIFISDPPATPAPLGLRPVVGDGGDLLDPSDPEARAGEGADRGLGPGARGRGLVPARRADAHVDGVDPLLLRRVGHALRGLHRGVGRGLVLRGLHDHAARRLRDRLGPREVREGDDDVVVRRVDVRDAPLRHGQDPSGPPPSGGAGASPGPSSPSGAGGGAGIWDPGLAGWRSFAIGERSSYTITFSSVLVTMYPGTVTRRPSTDTC